MKKSERIAKRVLESVFPGAEVRCRDTGAGLSVRDFDVLKGADVIAAVEVTTSTEGLTMSFQSQLKRREYSIPAKRTRGRWVVFLRPSKNLTRRATGIDDCLAEFERRGVERFIASTSVSDAVSMHQVFDEARKLGIEWADRLPPGEPGIFVLLDGDEVFCSSEDYVNPTVEELASKCDNRCKLSASGCGRRILSVVVDELTDYRTWKQIVDYPPIGVPPVLPSEVTEVWVIACDRSGRFVGWRTGADAWQHLGVFSVDRAS